MSMSSRGHHRTGFERESEHRRTRDPSYRDSHRSAPPREDEHADSESDLSYISGFEGLNLNSTHNGPYPAAAAATSPRRVHNSPARPYPGPSPRAERRPAQGSNMQSTEPQLQPGIDIHNSLGLVPSHSLSAGIPRSSPSRPLGQNVENSSSAYYSRREGYPSPSWWRSPSDFARPPERDFRDRRRPYPDQDPFVRSRRPEMTLECQCPTCSEHRHIIRNWAISRYDDRRIAPRSNYYPYMYPGPPSQGRYPTDTGRLYPNNDYFRDSPDHDDYSSYESGSDGYAFPDSQQRNHGLRSPGNAYYRGDGSDHEDSDGASYTGYERYDEYGDEYGEYEGDGYSD